MSNFSLPSSDQHVSIIGRNGSGKTQQGAWLLSHSDFHARPHIIFDYKGDELLNSIAHMQHISINSEVPAGPGVYMVKPLPGQEENVESFLWKVWAQNNTCLYVDEAFMIDKYSHAYNTLLVQGRSKHINIYNLTQRPTQCSRLVFSEASHFSVFKLIDKRDKKTVEGFAPLDLEENLPEYHSYWYNVKNDSTFLMQPVPERDIILATFNERLAEMAKNKKTNRRFI